MENAFIILPKEIVKKPVSDGSKILFALILDRMNLSLSNNWKDENDRCYIYFGIEEIANTMNCGKNKAIKMLSELEGEGLIERKKQGQGKASKLYLKEDFRKSESKTSEGLKSKHQEVSKANSNNTYNNNTYINNTENKSNHIKDDDVMRWMEKKSIYEMHVKKNICFDTVKERYGEVWCKEIVDIIVDVLMYQKPYIRINGQNFPAEVVKSRFFKINDIHIGYIHDSLSETKSKIKNIRAFLITAIYRSTETTENWYGAKVRESD